MLLLKAEVEVSLLLCLLMRRQDLDLVGPDLVLGVKIWNPDIHQENYVLIEVAPDE